MMIQSLFVTILLLTIIINSPVSADNIFNDIIKSFWNAIALTGGGLKFIGDFSKLASEQIGDTTPSNNKEYDFIVVGGGSAGATIAARLSEISDATVLLIEAGYNENLIMDIPIFCLFLLFDETRKLNHKNPSKNYCLGYKDKQCGLNTGKAMGGTGAINFMLATRGNRKNYDRWAEATGNDGWSYNGMLKYFKKLEAADLTLSQADSNYRNFDGPVRIGEAVYRTPLIDQFIEAGRQMGFPSPNDYNGEQQTGFSYMQTNQKNGERLTTSRAYLNPIRKRKNLHVSMNSQVNKILIDSDTKTAYGVEFTKYGRTIRVKAKKEVILSAGALGTPKLLMLSGIGPAKDLAAFDIPVLVDAPVGENLMDHPTYPGNTYFVNESLGFLLPDLFKPANPALQEYFTKRKGPLATPLLVEGFAYVDVNNPTPKNEDPNVEFMFTSTHLGSTLAIYEGFNIDSNYYDKSFRDSLYRYGYAIWPVIMQPKSRGKASLVSANPNDELLVDVNFFSHPDDIEVGVKAIRFAQKIVKTEAMKKYGSERYNYTVRGCEQYEEDSDDYWKCALRTFSQTLWHFSGTCKMGRENDTSAVVNPNLQVKNIKNLRVGDASIMPIIPNAHLQIPSIAIGERLADIIKSYWGYQTS